MQPQQQTIVTDRGMISVQPVFVAQPYQSAGVVQQYRHRQATISGILLIIAGSLSIVLNIVDLAVGTRRSPGHLYGYRYGYPYYYDFEDLSLRSNGVSGHGLWCGAMVSISPNTSQVHMTYTGAMGKMRNAESKMWNQKCGMTLIGRGDKPRDRWVSADYHISLSTGSAVKCRPAVSYTHLTLPTIYSV